ncbi:hypothetical protein D9M68_840370 [compost metagenome]
MAEAGHAAVDEARVGRAQAFLVEAVLLEAAGLEVLDHDVGLRRHLLQQRLPFGRGHVDGDRTLVAVAGGEVAGLVGVVAVRVLHEGRAPGARVVADAGAFDLDDVGAQVRKNLRAPRAREHAGQIEDLDAVECCGLGAHASDQFANAAMPVMARPRIRAWMSCVPS